jgi:hypothetical protein
MTYGIKTMSLKKERERERERACVCVCVDLRVQQQLKLQQSLQNSNISHTSGDFANSMNFNILPVLVCNKMMEAWNYEVSEH